MTKRDALSEAAKVADGINLAEIAKLPDGRRVFILGSNYLTRHGHPSTAIEAVGYSWQEAVAAIKPERRR